MKVKVGNTRLFFDLDGAKFVPDGPKLRERPTLLLLHGGPGFDHSHLKPQYAELADMAQLVYLDHRGNGRSDYSSREHWNLDQWADDVYDFCQVLGIERPIVIGNSFGGIVAMAYAIRHPEHPSKLVLNGTLARFRMEKWLEMMEKLGGKRARDVADRYWSEPSDEKFEAFLEVCMPLYKQHPIDPHWLSRSIRNMELLTHWERSDGQAYKFNLLPGLRRIRCPTLLISGDRDPSAPRGEMEDIAAEIPAEFVQFERLAGCGHCEFDPKDGLRVLREFIAS